jgi:heat-inducible transcriptional repressor
MLDLGISPATIRNELSKLEEMGYIYQPHTSSGRVPTDKGYRFYVDALAGLTSLGLEERDALLALFSAKAKELEGLMQETSQVLSRLTHSAAMVVAPRFRHSQIKHVDLIELHAGVQMLVLITDTGRVDKRILEGELDLAGNVLHDVQEYLNRSLNGKDQHEFSRMRSSLVEGFKDADLSRVIQAVGEMADEGEERIYWGVPSQLFRGADGGQARRVEDLMEALEKQYLILSMLNDVLISKGVMVRIGFENPAAELRELSFIGSSYALGDENVGSVGVLGPTRMDYARVIPMVEFTARLLSRALEILRG